MNCTEANFLQSSVWADVNTKIGHHVVSQKLPNGNLCVMIIKNARRGRYLEIPGGPLIDWQNPTEIQSTFQIIRKTATKYKCVFVRFRPQLLNTAQNMQILSNAGAKPATMHLAAEHTVILDLTQSIDDLLAKMRRQTRYEVRRAAKLGITVSYDNTKALFQEFHNVQAETAVRQHFVPPDLKTLLAERAAFGDNARLYVAKSKENEPIAYGLILINGDEAEYYEAASTPLNRHLPGAYALQWQVIQDLKELGVKRYNLWGIAPPNQPHHRYAGVTTFKTGFGGEIIEYIPAHDLIIHKIKYLPNLIIEKIRKKRRHL